jgi:hypothetical protein
LQSRSVTKEKKDSNNSFSSFSFNQSESYRAALDQGLVFHFFFFFGGISIAATAAYRSSVHSLEPKRLTPHLSKDFLHSIQRHQITLKISY